jgi:hypothetical protein
MGSWAQDIIGIGNSEGTFGTGGYQGAYTPEQMNGDLAMVHQAQGAQVDPVQQAQAREAQMGLVRSLQAQAAGQGPSVAQQQLQQGTDRNMAGALGLVASQRGMNPGAAARLAGNQLAGINQQAAGQATTARLQEQLAAQQGLAGVSGQMRGQDLDMAGQNAQLSQQAGQFNAGQYNQVLAQAQAAQQARIQQHNAQIAEMERQRQQANQQKFGQIVGGVTSAASGGAGGAASGAGGGVAKAAAGVV